MKATFATIIASFLAVASAAPTERATGPDVILCTGQSASAGCTPMVIPFRTDLPVTECQKLDASLYKNVGTFIVRSGLFCRVWTDSDDCSTPPGGNAMLFPPGTDFLHDYNGEDIGSSITAFTCQQCDSCTYP